MAQSDDTAKPIAPSPKTSDHRELGYGNVDARADIDGDTSRPSEIDGQMASGGQSGGDAYPSNPVQNDDGDNAGQSNQGYSGPANPNSTSTKGSK